MATSLDIYRRADAPSALDPVANDLVAVEKDKINSKASQSCPGASPIFTSWFQSNRNTAVLCNTGASGLFEDQRKAQGYWGFGG
jgi:hypothetical protein